MKNPLLTKRSYRVVRGGSWRDFAQFVRVSNRNYYGPTYTRDRLGFRIFRTSK